MTPTFFPSRAPSVSSTSTTRRLRGFQPAEVNKPKSAADHHSTAAVPAATPMPVFSNGNKENKDPVASSKPKEVPLSKSKKPSDSKKLTEAAELKGDQLRTPSKNVISDTACKSGFESPSKKKQLQSDPVSNPNHGEVSASESSTVEVVVDNQQEKSCWSRALPSVDTPTSSATAPKVAWDNGTSSLDKPSWLRAQTSPTGPGDIYDGPFNVNFHNLPPYKSPFKIPTPTAPHRTKNNQQTEATSSFNRQMANIKRNGHPAKDEQVQAAAISVQNGAGPMVEQSQVNGSQHLPSDNVSSKSESRTIPSHSKAPTSSTTTNTFKGNRTTEDQADMVAPHLRTSKDKSNTNSQREVIDATAEKKATLPPHLQNGSHLKDAAPPRETATDKPNTEQHINIDEELAAATQSAIDIENDVEVAAASASGTNNNEEEVAAAWHEVVPKEKTKHQAPGVTTSKSQDQPDALPPHLRKSKPKTPKAGTELKAGPHTSNGHDDQDHAVITSSGGSKTNANSRGNKRSPNSGGVTPANGIDSTTWKGKEPVNESQLGKDASELVGWDGKFMEPRLGEDWADRPQVRSKDKQNVVKAWTEDHAADIQAGLAESQEHLTIPVPAKHPETIPNPDEFNQAKRHLSANDAIISHEAKRSLTPAGELPTKEERRNHRRHKKDLINSQVALPPNEHAPEANIYLRPAEMKDMRQVTLIHNHYVLNSAFTQELGENEEIYWRERFQECHEDGNPFLVAIHRGQKASRDVQDVHRKKSETVVGFAFAADYGLKTTVYRYTLELELWVHHTHSHQGIGMTMLDRLLAAVDPGYNMLECAPLLGKYDQTRWSGGGHRIVKTVLVNLLYQETGVKELEWKKTWLSDKNFEYQNTLSQIGFKFDKPWVFISNIIELAGLTLI